MNTIKWISEWFLSNCDGDWEHLNQIKIFTVDNPGWVIQIDLSGTKYESIKIPYELFEKSENDWFGFSIKNGIYDAGGDLNKLDFLVNKFKEIVENHDIKHLADY
jgi:hypothetical protein